MCTWKTPDLQPRLLGASGLGGDYPQRGRNWIKERLIEHFPSLSVYKARELQFLTSQAASCSSELFST